MDRYPQPSNGHGSLRDIQVLINRFPDKLTERIKTKLAIKSDAIDWVSPLSSDGFAEYRDEGFLKALEIYNLSVTLNNFWPKKGPQWDALGVGTKREVFLVEAKANIPEIVSPGSTSKGKSRLLITKSLNNTKEYLKIKKDIDWINNFYQYTNRLAHLYFLRVINKIPAYLIFVYFLGDESVAGPKTTQEWQAALIVMKKCIGLTRHTLTKYISEIFIDIKEIGL